MAGNIELGFTISKEAAELVKQGVAEISSGGVRYTDTKRFIELAKPVAQSITSEGNPLSMTLNAASSVVGNAQMGFLQHSVNIANRKLTTTLKKLDLLQGSLGMVTALSWVNCALGMVNCGISVAGFKATLKRLDEVAREIQSVSGKIENEILRGLKRRFNEYCYLINADMAALEKYELTNSIEMTIDQHCASVIAYLEEVIDRFENHDIDGHFGCNVIFNLSMGFCQEVKGYSAQYYYKNGKMPPNYKQWITIIEKISSDDFRKHLKQYLLFESDMSMEQKYVAFDGAMLAIESKLEEMDFHLEMIHQLTLEQYRNTDLLLSERIASNSLKEIGELVYIPLASA